MANQLSLATLDTLSSNGWELESYVGEKAKQIILEAAGHWTLISTLMEEMKYVEKTLPDLHYELRTI